MEGQFFSKIDIAIHEFGIRIRENKEVLSIISQGITTYQAYRGIRNCYWVIVSVSFK